jgi:hypothetical protein
MLHATVPPKVNTQKLSGKRTDSMGGRKTPVTFSGERLVMEPTEGAGPAV